METIEGNKLIAEFVGLEKRPASEHLFERFLWDGYLFPATNLRYHTSWDWLMPVVEKIEGIDNCRFGFDMNVFGVEIIDYREEDQPIIIQSIKYEKKTRIELLYEAVVEFIQWYNTALSAPAQGEKEGRE